MDSRLCDFGCYDDLTQAFSQDSERAHGCIVPMSCHGCACPVFSISGLGECMLPILLNAVMNISEQRVPWLAQGAENTLYSHERKLCGNSGPLNLAFLWALPPHT